MAVCEGCGHENEPTADFCTNRACRRYLGWGRTQASRSPVPVPVPVAVAPDAAPDTRAPAVAATIPVPGAPVSPVPDAPDAILQINRQRQQAMPVMPPPDRPTATAPSGQVSSDGNQGLMMAIDASHLTIDPGGSATFTAHLKNRGTVVDAMTVDVIGLPREWVTVEPRTVNLFVGAEATVQVRLSPPMAPTTNPGLHAVEVAAWSGTNPNVRCVQNLTLNVTGFRDIDAGVEPAIAVGRFQGKFSLRVANGGNASVTATMHGAHDEGTVGVVCRPGTVTVAPGSRAKVTVSAKPPFHFTGAANLYSLSITVQTPEFSRTYPVTYKQPPVLSKWVARILLAVVAIVVVVVGVKLLVSHKPKVPSLPHRQGAVTQVHDRFTGAPGGPRFPTYTLH